MLAKEKLCDLEDFANLKSICYEPGDSIFREHFRSYIVESDLATVWQTYTTIPPQDTWQGEMVTFGFQYDRNTNKITYADDPYSGLRPGQMLFMNLSLLGGWVNIAVAHEIMEVNENEKFIKICYIETGAAEGTQLIQMQATPEGQTKIDHTTFYRSSSEFRDTKLYPTLHTWAIDEFHGHIRDKIATHNQ